jgi:hypothetical protein
MVSLKPRTAVWLTLTLPTHRLSANLDQFTP